MKTAGPIARLTGTAKCDLHASAGSKEFLEHFTIERRETIAGTERILYLMRSRVHNRE